jgi:1,4-alpha-glucan branching enzyme
MAGGTTAMLKYSSRGERELVKVTFVLPSSDVDHPVSVLGDFNGWNPLTHPLRKRSNGTHSTAIEVPDGTAIRFKYLAGDGTWFCDPEAPTVDHHEYGTVDSFIVAAA